MHVASAVPAGEHCSLVTPVTENAKNRSVCSPTSQTNVTPVTSTVDKVPTCPSKPQRVDARHWVLWIASAEVLNLAPELNTKRLKLMSTSLFTIVNEVVGWELLK